MMIRKLVSVVVLVFVFMGVLGLTIDVYEVEAPYPMVYIRDDGSIDPSSANITCQIHVELVRVFIKGHENEWLEDLQ